MTEAKLKFPEVVGKLVAELSIVEEPDGKEALVRFSDGTQPRLRWAFVMSSTRGTAKKKRETCRYLIGKSAELDVVEGVAQRPRSCCSQGIWRTFLRPAQRELIRYGRNRL